MTTSIRFSCAVGSSRSQSEDRVEVVAHGDDIVVVVADGAGGLRGGAAAADAVIEAVRGALADPRLDVRSATRWGSIFGAVDRVLAARMVGETTAIVAVVGTRGIVGVSVGDSEAWVVASTGIDDLTAGQQRGRLGSGRAAPRSFHRDDFDGMLVVGTDGLFKYARADKIAHLVRTNGCDDAARLLVELVRLRSGELQDDVGVAIARPPKVEKPR